MLIILLGIVLLVFVLYFACALSAALFNEIIPAICKRFGWKCKLVNPVELIILFICKFFGPLGCLGIAALIVFIIGLNKNWW